MVIAICHLIVKRFMCVRVRETERGLQRYLRARKQQQQQQHQQHQHQQHSYLLVGVLGES